MKMVTARETGRPIIYLANLYFMKFIILILLFLLVHRCAAQTPTGGLFLTSTHNNKTRFFPCGTTIRIKLKGVPSFKGKIISVSDSTFTLLKKAVPKYNMMLTVDKIEAIAIAKKSFSVILGCAMIFSGSITFFAGNTAVNASDPPGFRLFSNRDVGEAEEFCGALLMGGGIPMVWPRKNYKMKEWNLRLDKGQPTLLNK